MEATQLEKKKKEKKTVNCARILGRLSRGGDI